MLKISDLPPEIHQGILEYLEFSDAIPASQVSRKWQEIFFLNKFRDSRYKGPSNSNARYKVHQLLFRWKDCNSPFCKFIGSTGTQRNSSLKGIVTNSVSGINDLTLRVKQCLPLEEVYEEEEEEELCFDLVKLGDCPFLNEPAFLRIPDSYKNIAGIINGRTRIPEMVEKGDTVKVKLQFSSRDKNCGIHPNSNILEFAEDVTVMDLLKKTFEEALYEHVENRREAEDLDRHIQEVGAIKFCMEVGFGDGLEADACVYTDIMPFK